MTTNTYMSCGLRTLQKEILLKHLYTLIFIYLYIILNLISLIKNILLQKKRNSNILN